MTSSNNQETLDSNRKAYPDGDPVTRFLRARGFEVSAYYMGKTSLLLGARFEYQGVEIVYRVEGDTLIMAIYRRLHSSESGLKNIFEPFIWFSERLIYDIPEIRFMRGNPDALSAPDGKGLTTRKLHRFYRHLMGAEPDPEPGWYRFELINYKTMRQRQQERSSKKD
ncbi:hypothetical protein [Endozoicomonas elysicola]|uniref:Uncharacterized protein n=1 Tax=Endozoicomonas elysicola TaxID=305900 RepID=A0A081KG58_9GAMM|nr:hypothetical protein [Endozoicomonas elysicola]KEI73134.1 hypothetical protein GV64_22655 [Endozoicomonas elysicola]